MDGTGHLNSEGRTLKVTRRYVYVYNTFFLFSLTILSHISIALPVLLLKYLCSAAQCHVPRDYSKRIHAHKYTQAAHTRVY